MSFEWPTKRRVRAILALSITAYGMWKDLIPAEVVSGVIMFYFGAAVAGDSNGG